MSKVLKPCPFCGKEAVIFTYYGNLPIQWGHCGIRFNSVEKWNNRPIEQRLEAELDALRARCERLEGAYKVIIEAANYAIYRSGVNVATKLSDAIKTAKQALEVQK